ncbi:type IV pilin [Salinadaptatus halalkaliphilus]|uniref:Type IV pilin n=1 Tax=Salinadaptatus halalkaliphilus TaxID=2419781 RepID=A0A4S3TK73_9EURY|nr:type IV pilin N-terminal domain-containing protein [Salinadaptatus halalkaliphilus]THE64519.1 type IV pilin [Salinadaptatus halalkaliphilus]
MPREQHGQRAVSPVIGIILLVAVTVILAAVVAGFAMDIDPGGDDIQAGITIDVEDTTNTIVVDIITLGNADHVTIIGDPAGNLESPPTGSLEDDDLEELDVGDTLRISDDDLESGAESGRITVIGVQNGDETVVNSEDYDLS